MIFYNSEKEAWVNEDNTEFYVDMSPHTNLTEMFFETEDDFWSWYYCSE